MVGLGTKRKCLVFLTESGLDKITIKDLTSVDAVLGTRIKEESSAEYSA